MLDQRNYKNSALKKLTYSKLPGILKRYSFEAKMRTASVYSSMWIGKHNFSEFEGVMPWCLETFVMLSMEAEENGCFDFLGNRLDRFYDINNVIWNESNKSLVALGKRSRKYAPLDFIISVTALTQFPQQENPLVKHYRYWKIFNDQVHPVNQEDVEKRHASPVYIREKFVEKFGTDYDDFLLLGHILEVLFEVQHKNPGYVIPEKALRYLLYEKFPTAAKELVISRWDYVKMQRQYAGAERKASDYVRSLRPSYQYPFVEEKGAIYFPLPHLLSQSVTTSIYYRLTQGNAKLRTLVGKNILEAYLFELIKGSNCYGEVYPEQVYSNKGEAKSPDVLARENEEVLFLDSKSTTPRIGVRLLDEKDYDENIRIVGENIAKLYRQIEKFGEYDPFKENHSNNPENYWGVIVVLEDSFIHRRHFFRKAADTLDISEGSSEWQWLINHIRVASLYEVEILSLSGYSIIQACKDRSAEGELNFGLAGNSAAGRNFINKDYDDFCNHYTEQVVQIVSEMDKKDLLV